MDRRDAHNKSMTVKTVFRGRTPGCVSDELVERTDPRQLTWSEAQGSRTVQDQNNDLLQQMPHIVCDCAKSGQADASCAKPGKTHAGWICS